MTTIYWGNYPEDGIKWFELLLLNPAPALSEISKARTTTAHGHFMQCPAFTAIYKNTYVIKSPIDIEVTYNAETKLVQASPQGQEFFDKNITLRGHMVGDNDPFLMGIFIGYLFIATEECSIELIPASMHSSEFIDKTRLISATFDIHKWYRPIEIAFEFKNKSDTIKIKRGDPLAYVRFTNSNGTKISLERKEFPKETLDAVDACVTVKKSSLHLPLKTLYELAEPLRNKLGLKKKCPFNWRNK
ncbi:MAG: hypothetical protein ACR2JS_03390 [Candidatus Nanopelagicales bacterium]